MNAHDFTFRGADLTARADGSLHWPAERVLVVSDLHLGKADRISRREGRMLPPYEVTDTLTRLEAAIDATSPATVICLGDSFDDLDARLSLPENARGWLARMQAGRRWIWIEGNHDPGPVDLGGTHMAQVEIGPLIFRHIAAQGAQAEVSGHYHPKVRIKARGCGPARPAFVYDASRVILPAFGTYTGGLRAGSGPVAALVAVDAVAVLTGVRALAVPLAACV